MNLTLLLLPHNRNFGKELFVGQKVQFFFRFSIQNGKNLLEAGYIMDLDYLAKSIWLEQFFIDLTGLILYQLTLNLFYYLQLLSRVEVLSATTKPTVGLPLVSFPRERTRKVISL
ncbi:MAG: hypothetical protein PF689_05285 [Deltaproteobacteria bacterium]|nr:hypothetical protein [Deltaproteobacteria bacterium]